MSVDGLKNKESKLRNTLRKILSGLEYRYQNYRSRKVYSKWIAANSPSPAELFKLRQEAEELPVKPLISVIVPVYNVKSSWLKNCVDSVLNQIYSNWQLCIADDLSTESHIRPILEGYAAADDRINVVFRNVNGNISAASNSALELATGEFCVLLDHDDELSSDALLHIAKELNEYPNAAFIYSDEDKIDAAGKRFDPAFKPEWSRDYFYSVNFTNHLSAYRTEVLRKVGGFREGFEGSQDYDLVLRFIEQVRDDQIRHIPRILYHWRAIDGSVALSGSEKPYAHERARKAIRSHLERTGVKANVTSTVSDLHRVEYAIPSPEPSVSMILFGSKSDESSHHLEQIRKKTGYKNFEVKLVEEGSSLAVSLNAAATSSNGEILCFLDGLLLPSSDDWLNELTSFAIQPGIGCVGGKIVNDRGEIVAGGLVFNDDAIVATAHYGLRGDAGGNMQRNLVISNYSAVSLLALAVRRTVFEQVGGFDSDNLTNHFLDVDLCLRIREKGFRVVHTPYALFRSGSSLANPDRNGPSSAEIAYLKERWRSAIENDPFSIPNFLNQKNFSINS